MRAMRSVLVLTSFLPLLTPFLACSSAPLRPAGTLCSSDSDCGAGLACLGYGAFSDAGCTTSAMACSKPCTFDSDCASLGARYKCFLACGGTRSCGATS